MSLTEKDFFEEFRKKLFSLVSPDSKLIVAFSGGCDSLGLLALCSKAVSRGNLLAVYVNHNIRGLSELESETELNCYNCDSLHVPLIIREIPRFKVDEYACENSCGKEAAARALRYEILEEERVNNGFDFILTAHHLDDQLETVFMKKIQNSPEPSLRGIAEKNGCVVRPFLSFGRQEIQDYVSSLELSWSTDSTNSDNSILRNKIRNIILPEKMQENPCFASDLLSLRDRALKECEGLNFSEDEFLEIEVFNKLSKAQKLLCLFDFWDRIVGTSRGLSQALADRLIEQTLCLSDKGAKIIESNGGCFEIYNGRIYLSCKEKDCLYEAFEQELFFELNQKVKLLDGRILTWDEEAPSERTKDDLYLSRESFEGKAVVRYVRQGDRITLKDSSKTVLRLLQDLKVPASLRKRVPVIADESGICAVFASSFGCKNRIARKFCDKNGTRFVLVK